MSKYDEQALKNAQKMQKSAKKTLKKAKQKIPQNTAGNGTKTTTANKKTTKASKTKNPIRKHGSNADKTQVKKATEAKKNTSIKSRELPTSTKNAMKESEYRNFVAGVGDAVIDNSIPGIGYSIAKGQKLSDSDFMKSDRATKGTSKSAQSAHNVGEIVGTGLSYLSAYGAAGKATGKAAAKVVGSKAGQKAIKKVATTSLGKKAGKEAIEKAATSAAKDAIADATVGTAMNLGIARGQGLEGEDLAKDMAINAALDFGLGGAMEVAPAAVKAASKAIKGSRTAKASAKTARYASEYGFNAEKTAGKTAKEGSKSTAKELPGRASYTTSATKEPQTIPFNNAKTEGKTKATREIPHNSTGPSTKAQSAQTGSKTSYVPAEDVDNAYKNVYNNYIDSVDEGTKQFVEKAKSGNINKKATKKLGEVSQEEADKIKELTGVDVTGYQRTLPANSVEHIEKRHGSSGLADKSMSDVNDIARINYVLDNYDNIELLTKGDGTVAKTSAMQGTDQGAAKLIKYKKRIDGHYYVVEAVAENNKKQLRIISAYIEKAGNKMPAGRPTNPVHGTNVAPQVTSEPPNAESAFSDIINAEEAGVKPQNASGVQVLTKSEPQGIPYNTAKSAAGTEAPQQIPYNTANKTTQTAKLTPKAQQKIFDAVEKRSGAKIVYADLPDGIDGTYQNGVITISNKAQNPVYTVLKHELTHHIETSGYYAELSDFIQNTMREAGYDVDRSISDIISDYARQGKNLTNEEAQKEFVAKFAGEYLFNSEKSIERLARENPNVFQRVYDWIVDTIKKIGADDETKFLIDAQRKYEKALKTAKAETNGDLQYLFGGEKSLKADKAAKKTAEEMTEANETPERIWRETGWKIDPVNGDAKYEIDDYASKANFYKLERKGKGRLEDFFKHDELYEAYPEIRKTKVYAKHDGKNGSKAYFNKYNNSITINLDYISNSEELRSTLLHEIQHRIQKKEGFEMGGNRGQVLDALRKKYKEELKNVNQDKYNELKNNKAKLREYIDEKIKTDYHTSSVDEAATKVYHNLLGEKESRSVQARAEMFDLQRRMNYPNYEEGAVRKNGKSKGKAEEAILEDSYEARHTGGIHRLDSEAANLRNKADNESAFSLPENRKTSGLGTDSSGRELSEGQQKYFQDVDSKLRDENGNIKTYYHGTGRADRVGREFRSDRATSGPMAFFTDDNQIAKNYSKDKADTSISYDSDYDDYFSQFRTTVNGKDSSVGKLWNTLPLDKRIEATEKARHITWDDDLENIIYDPTQREGNGSFNDYLLREHNGNVIDALTESWLENGELLGREEDFLDILKKAGIDADVRYMNPNFRDEAVYETYLNIKNAFDTSTVDQAFVDRLNRFAETADMSKYAQSSNRADIWDKNNVDIAEFTRRLEDDIKNGTSRAWTSIPDVVTDFLKSEGFDGIVDAGGKNGGAGHQVAIPFYPEQIKDVNNANPTLNSNIDLSTGRNLAETDYTARLRNASENLYGENGNKYLQIPQANAAAKTMPKTIPMATKATQTETQQSLPYNTAKTRKVASEAPDSMSEEKWKYLMGANKRTANETSEEAWTRVLNEADERYKDKHGLNDEQFKAFFSDPATSTKETKKGQWYEHRQARNAYKEIGAAVGIDKNSNKAYIKEEIDAAAEKMRNGSLSKAERDGLFENILSGTGKEMSAEEKAAARVQFDSALDALENEMNIVKRYTERRSSDITVDQMDSLISSLGKLKRDAEKTKSKIVLSSEDRTLVDQLLKGNITPEKVRAININAHNIIEVYNAEKPVYEIKKALKKVGDETKQGYRDVADDFLTGSENWKDKIGFSYARETPERNFVDVAGKEAGERINSEFITPIHEHEASATRMKNDLRDEVKSLNLSSDAKYSLEDVLIDAPGLDQESKVSEETLVQLFGEGLIKKEDLTRIGADADKIEAAAKTMRGIYNQLIEKANNELIRHGYEPIEFRKDYFPHFSEDKPDSMLAKIGHYLGIDMAKDELPTDIAGLTHTFRPGKKWFGNALQRTGKATEYNAVKGFDLYIEGISDVIYHTEDIQKLRALESEIRFKYSDDGIKKRVKEVRDSDAPDTVKESLIEKIYEEGNTKLGGMATWLRNYTDQLAGKKSQFDRVFEQGLGRGIYNTTKALENRVAANMVALNPGSWLTNFIPLVQAGEISPKYVIEGMAQTISNRFRKVDDIADISTFLTNRKGSDTLWKTNIEKIQNVLTSPMQMIDNFTSESLVRAKYAEGIKKGLNEVDAIDAADRFAADIIADRSKGALPTMFNSKNPISKIFTMYQVEVNNQWSHLMKDIPQSKENVAQVALAFTNFALGAYIFNDVYERIVGRRTALDPISWVNDFVGDATGKKLPNFTEALENAMNGEGVSLEETDKKSGGGAVTSLGENVAQDIPFIGGLLEGGRVPISSALPSFSTLATTTGNLISGDADTKKGLMTIGKELSKPATYILPPVGGGQIKKAVEATRAFSNGGVYGLDKDGNQQLKFATDTTPSEVAKGLLFGQYAIGNSDDYVSSGFNMLSVNKTQAYQALVETGMKNTEAEDFVRSLPSKKTEMREAIMNSSLTPKQKNAVGKVLDENSPDYRNQATFAYSQMSDSKQKVVNTLKKSGMTQSKASAIYDVQNKYSSQTEKVNALLEEGYKDAVFEALGLGEKGIAAGKALHKAGVTNLTYQSSKKGADTNNSGNVSIEEAEKYLDKKSYSRAEKYALMKALTGCADKNNKYYR